MARFIEVKPVNPQITDREWVNADQVKSIFRDPGQDVWSLWTIDNRILIPAHPDQLEAMLNAVS